MVDIDEFNNVLKKLSNKKSSYKHLIKIAEETSEFKTEIFKTLNKELSLTNERFINELSDLLNTIEIYFESLDIKYPINYEEGFKKSKATKIILQLGKLATKNNNKIIDILLSNTNNKLSNNKLKELLREDKLIESLNKLHKNLYKYLKYVKIDLEEIRDFRYKQITKHL